MRRARHRAGVIGRLAGIACRAARRRAVGHVRGLAHGAFRGQPVHRRAPDGDILRRDEVDRCRRFLRRRGRVKVRFMPDAPGEWRYVTRSNRWPLTDRAVRSGCARHRQNHGPVRVRSTFHFAYADGTSFSPIGTTVYSWTSSRASVKPADAARAVRRGADAGLPSRRRRHGVDGRSGSPLPARRRATGTSAF